MHGLPGAGHRRSPRLAGQLPSVHRPVLTVRGRAALPPGPPETSGAEKAIRLSGNAIKGEVDAAKGAHRMETPKALEYYPTRAGIS
ncbi:hypothetical protein Misp03_20640 [Microbispora sp. NBRC 16548]|nr:hypothetical protein Misp03_20640 [Microbispora sp. NBRC 16548]